MFVTFVRTIILYIVICTSLRIMGKRQIGELQPSELVVTILISNIATLPIEDTNTPLLSGLVPIFLLVCLEVFASILGIKSKTARKIICGTPTFIIKDGKIDQKMLRALRFSIDDLMESLREQGIFDINDVSYAIVETTGKVSIFKKFAQQEVTAQMLNITDPSISSSPPVILISDGKIVSDSTKFCEVDEKWVHKKLKENKLQLSDVFIMTCNKEKQFSIIKREI